MKKNLHAVDMRRLSDALAIEGRARKRLGKLSDTLRKIYEDGGKPTPEELKKLQRSVRRWEKTARTVANVVDEQIPKK